MKIKNIGFTLVEVLIAAGILTLLLGGAFTLFLQGNSTVTKSNWINNATKDEVTAARRLSELSYESSYPSKAATGIVNVNDKDDFKAVVSNNKTSKEDDEMKDVTSQSLVIFPMCKPATTDSSGRVVWANLKLETQETANNIDYCKLVLDTSKENAYTEPNTATKFASSTVEKSYTLLKDIQKYRVYTKEALSGCYIDLTFELANPRDPKFKKEVKFTLMLNVDMK